MARSNAATVTRRSFSRLKNPLDVPHLIDIQRRSFEELVDPKNRLLGATIDDISPTEDYTGIWRSSSTSSPSTTRPTPWRIAGRRT